MALDSHSRCQGLIEGLHPRDYLCREGLWRHILGKEVPRAFSQSFLGLDGNDGIIRVMVGKVD